jgi:hypothetical protein
MASKQSYQLADQKGVSQRVSQQILKSLGGGEIDQWSKPSMLMWLVLHPKVYSDIDDITG